MARNIAPRDRVQFVQSVQHRLRPVRVRKREEADSIRCDFLHCSSQTSRIEGRQIQDRLESMAFDGKSALLGESETLRTIVAHIRTQPWRVHFPCNGSYMIIERRADALPAPVGSNYDLDTEPAR